MKTILRLIIIAALVFPVAAFAEEPIIEKAPGANATKKPAKANVEAAEATAAEMAEEQIVEKDIGAKEEKAPAKVEAKEVVDELPPADDVGSRIKEVDVKIEKTIRIAPAFNLDSRKGRFQGGIVGPGIYAGNKSINAMMGIGAEGEYFFFERLSAGLRIQFATDFKKDASPNAILSFLPQVRYVFDFDKYPRLSVYAQAGAGVALLEGKTAYADIAIPGGGFWWRWNENFSVGFDVSMHILVRSTTAVAGFFGPAFRYLF